MPAPWAIHGPDGALSGFSIDVGTRLAQDLGGRRGEALAVRRGDLEFLAYLNAWVDARRSDGWLDARASEWFGRLDWAEAEPKP